MAKKKARTRAEGELHKLVGTRPRALALAALHISESMLLELEAAEVLTPREIRGLLKDAATTLRNAGTQVDNRNCIVASEILEAMRLNYGQARKPSIS